MHVTIDRRQRQIRRRATRAGAAGGHCQYAAPRRGVSRAADALSRRHFRSSATLSRAERAPRPMRCAAVLPPTGGSGPDRTPERPTDGTQERTAHHAARLNSAGASRPHRAATASSAASNSTASVSCRGESGTRRGRSRITSSRSSWTRRGPCLWRGKESGAGSRFGGRRRNLGAASGRERLLPRCASGELDRP